MTTEQEHEGSAARVGRIRELNDELRTLRGHVLRGQYVVSNGIVEKGVPFVAQAVKAVRTFSGFTLDNDPHYEHDMAFLSVDGVSIYFKIDYYDPTFSMLSDDPADPEKTRRVLTIALAEEY